MALDYLQCHYIFSIGIIQLTGRICFFYYLKFFSDFQRTSCVIVFSDKDKDFFLKDTCILNLIKITHYAENIV